MNPSLYEKSRHFRMVIFLSMVGFSCATGQILEQPVNSAVQVVPSMATWSMDTNTISLTAQYSPFDVLVNLRSLGRDKDLMDDEVHSEIKKRAEFGVKKGVRLVADIDVRLALPTFEAQHPDELQQMIVIQEVDWAKDGSADVQFRSRRLNDHYHRPYQVREGAFLKAFAYDETEEGMIAEGSLLDISANCVVKSATKDGVHVRVQNTGKTMPSKVMVMAVFTYLYPAVFAPHLMSFQSYMFEKYADVPLAGAHNDEWGFPATLSEGDLRREFWYSKHQVEAYAVHTDGRDLLQDIVLMHKGVDGREDERFGVINRYVEMIWKRTGELEEHFYELVKKTFGPYGIVGVHPTWFPYPERREFKKNGLNWWVAKRDWAQTDEVVPFSIRTSLSKKWNSPVWYNMYYRYGLPTGTMNTDDYEQELWSAALSGGRINHLPSFVRTRGILASDFIRAETRIRLLNYIQPTPQYCPVAIVFGHAAITNWMSSTYEDSGLALADSLWHLGIPTDLIPSSEIANGSLSIDENGYIRYGEQRYEAVVLYNPEFEKQSTAGFFRNAAATGKTRLFRTGQWTRDFDGYPLNGIGLLPDVMQAEADIDALLSQIPALLSNANSSLQTPATRLIEGFGHQSYAPPTTGYSYLLDGTLVQVAGTKHAAGDTLQSTRQIGVYDVTIDAIGVAAVRLDQSGNLEALAAGGLKKIETEKFSLHLSERVDLALWKGQAGHWEGVIQGWDGEIPERLLSITTKWTRLDLPDLYPVREKEVRREVPISTLGFDAIQKENFDDVVVDVDGNAYPVTSIGNQVWMVGNLKTSRFKTGEPLYYPGIDQGAWYENHSGAYGWYENDSAKYDLSYGKLYNWRAVQDNKLCPQGWRVPNDVDWNELLNHLESTSGLSQAGNFGFVPIAGGYRHSYGTYFGGGRNGIWWSSSGRAKRIVWDQDRGTLYMADDRELPVTYGFSVCCVKE